MEDLAWLVIGIAPFFLISRWRTKGFIMAVFAGWGIGSISSYLSPRTELVESVFAVLWFCIGWLYMFAWCLIAAGVIVWVKIACKLLAKASARLEAFSKNVYSS